MKAITVAAWVVVVAVAATAAVVSYGHIETLALAHGQPLLAARLLPVSVDGLLTAASLVLLAAARAGRASPVLARLMLGLGVAATIVANLAYGYRYGIVGMAVSAWPAVAFVGSVETVMTMIRQERDEGPAATESDTPDATVALLDAIAANPGASVASLARKHGVHPRTAQRLVARSREAA